MEKKIKTAYVCTQCGAIYPRWQGQCNQCGEWNSLVEERIISGRRRSTKTAAEKPGTLAQIGQEQTCGIESGLKEFDRVLGGGLLRASTVLLAGEPGIGKSTLILQAADAYTRRGLNVLYVTGEESLTQLKKRADRLSIGSDDIAVINLANLEEIVAVIENSQYQVVIIDSIQTVSSGLFQSPSGTVGQVRESAARLIEIARRNEFALFLIGHVTKEGMVAGPKILEHMVDVVLSFEGDSQYLYRLLRPVKNRYGSTFELGVFEMSPTGLAQVENPSMLFLSGIDHGNRSGAVVAASCEGSRPILVEIQALVSPASYGMPQRVAGGLDNKRLALLLAILEKRMGIPMGGNDVFVSIAGGLRLGEPAIDLAVLAAIVSSLRDIPVSSKTVLAGEVGLSGEVRAIGMPERRVAEATKLGFERIVLPEQIVRGIDTNKIELVGVASLEKTLELLF
ncbi:MAG: DNA repair protein RadA [Candidatus Zixiibacteriota bacterium]|nr:MAG: DNA repair protein RadA [candidate division Zixibacteria bacterium]